METSLLKVISAYSIAIGNSKICRKEGKKRTGMAMFKECSKILDRTW